MGNSVALVPQVEAPAFEDCGPAMQAITENQRRFVIAMVEAGGDATRAAVAAGYGGTDNARAVAVHTLVHNDKVLRAIKEEAEKRLKFSALIGYKALHEIANDASHKQRFQAAVEILNRAGLLVRTEHKLIVDDNRKTKDIISDIVKLARENGIDPKTLLGNDVDIIDGEFEEVAKAPEGFGDLGDIF